MIEVHPASPDRIADLDALFATDGVVDRCWCMWFLMRVADFHEAGREGNRESFCELMEATDEPLGVIAYRDGEAVGWCAVGPRARYERAVKTPTLKGRDPTEDDDVWLAPCFYIREDARGEGVANAMLERAVEIAAHHGAKAIEGFPDATSKKNERGARGNEPMFTDCGFSPVRRPSNARVIMRRELG